MSAGQHGAKYRSWWVGFIIIISIFISTFERLSINFMEHYHEVATEILSEVWYCLVASCCFIWSDLFGEKELWSMVSWRIMMFNLWGFFLQGRYYKWCNHEGGHLCFGIREQKQMLIIENPFIVFLNIPHKDSYAFACFWTNCWTTSDWDIFKICISNTEIEKSEKR